MGHPWWRSSETLKLNAIAVEPQHIPHWFCLAAISRWWPWGWLDVLQCWYYFTFITPSTLRKWLARDRSQQGTAFLNLWTANIVAWAILCCGTIMRAAWCWAASLAYAHWILVAPAPHQNVTDQKASGYSQRSPGNRTEPCQWKIIGTESAFLFLTFNRSSSKHFCDICFIDRLNYFFVND